MKCAICGKPLSPGEERRMPKALVALASGAAAFLHAGMWVAEELSGDFCPRDASIFFGVFLLGAVGILCGVSVGVAMWLNGPR